MCKVILHQVTQYKSANYDSKYVFYELPAKQCSVGHEDIF